jgi:metal-dependent HD superfamily phosphatase/phosphodiesterase
MKCINNRELVITGALMAIQVKGKGMENETMQFFEVPLIVIIALFLHFIGSILA